MAQETYIRILDIHPNFSSIVQCWQGIIAAWIKPLFYRIFSNLYKDSYPWIVLLLAARLCQEISIGNGKIQRGDAMRTNWHYLAYILVLPIYQQTKHGCVWTCSCYGHYSFHKFYFDYNLCISLNRHLRCLVPAQ